MALRRGSCCALVLAVQVLAVLAWPVGEACAQEGAPLTYLAPDACPPRQALVAEVERILVRPWSALPADVGIAIQLDDVEGGFALTVVLAEGERILHDLECRPLVLAAALIVALAIDPDAAVLSVSTPEPEPERLSPSPPPAPVERSPRLELGSPYDRRPRPLPAPLLGIGAGVVLDVGLLPQPSAGPAIEGVLRIGMLDVRLRLTYLAPSTALRPDGIGAEVSAWLGDVHGCVRPILDPRLAVCGGLHGGVVLGSALGPVTSPIPGQVGGPWVAVGAGLWLPWSPWDALDVELSIEGLLGLVRPRFEIDGIGTIFESFSAGARLGLVVHLDLRP